MKTITLIVVLLFLSTFASANDDSFSVEESLKPIPPEAVRVIKRFESRANEPFKCSLHGKTIDLSGSGKCVDLVVTTKNACMWGASAGPVWVLRNIRGKYSVVLNVGTASVDLMKETKNGLRNIKTSHGTAGYADLQMWAFTGKTYRITRSYYFAADDEKTCRQFPDICPFEH